MYKRWEPKKDRFSARNLLWWLKSENLAISIAPNLIGFITATFLRLNNIGMVERRDAVLAADKEKLDKAEAKKTLTELQNYVSSHMNSDMDKGIILSNIYQKDYNEAQRQRISQHQ